MIHLNTFLQKCLLYLMFDLQLLFIPVYYIIMCFEIWDLQYGLLISTCKEYKSCCYVIHCDKRTSAHHQH